MPLSRIACLPPFCFYPPGIPHYIQGYESLILIWKCFDASESYDEHLGTDQLVKSANLGI